MMIKRLTTKIAKLGDTPVLWLALAAGAGLRFINITKSSIWHDEGYSLMLAPQSVSQILARTGRDVHPPLYYLSLHFWLELFGHSELAARSLSLACSVGTIVIIFFLIRDLFGPRPARLAALLAAAAPFLIRYAQEARMYAMVAFWLALATLLLVKAETTKATKLWLGYGLVMALAFYTHYFAVFMVPVHWLYVSGFAGTAPKFRQAIRQLMAPKWILANLVVLGLFLPWLPVAYRQFSRVQAAFWIPRVTLNTLPATLAQFMTFTDLGRLVRLRWLLVFFLIAGLVAVWILAKDRRRQLALLAAYSWFGPVAGFLLSLKRPIYVDRYFVFAAVAFYGLVAVMLDLVFQHRPKIGLASLVIVFGLFAVGIHNVSTQSNHRMRQVAAEVNDRFRPGDGLVSGELYTYFDFSYYNRTGQTLQLLAPAGLSGYGESSLLYDRADQIVVRSFSQLRPASHYVWVIGTTGQHDYFDRVPANWQMVGRWQAGYVAAQQYFVTD